MIEKRQLLRRGFDPLFYYRPALIKIEKRSKLGKMVTANSCAAKYNYFEVDHFESLLFMSLDRPDEDRDQHYCC